MYCPKCGTKINENNFLYGGTASYCCSGCGFYLYDHKPFTKELIEESTPIFSEEKAQELREATKG